MAGRDAIRSFGRNEPARLRRLRGRFSAMVTPGETLTMRSRPSGDQTRVHFEIVNDEGRVVVADGFAELSNGDASPAGVE
jgi:acyl dehydratase